MVVETPITRMQGHGGEQFDRIRSVQFFRHQNHTSFDDDEGAAPYWDVAFLVASLLIILLYHVWYVHPTSTTAAGTSLNLITALTFSSISIPSHPIPIGTTHGVSHH